MRKREREKTSAGYTHKIYTTSSYILSDEVIMTSITSVLLVSVSATDDACHIPSYPVWVQKAGRPE